RRTLPRRPSHRAALSRPGRRRAVRGRGSLAAPFLRRLSAPIRGLKDAGGFLEPLVVTSHVALARHVRIAAWLAWRRIAAPVRDRLRLHRLPRALPLHRHVAFVLWGLSP